MSPIQVIPSKKKSRFNGPFDRVTMAIHKLRVNISSLAFEARYLRKEEKRCGICYEAELRDHRVNALRVETRAALLARTILLGRQIGHCENGPFDVDLNGRDAMAKLCAKVCSKLERLGVVRHLLFACPAGMPIKEALVNAVCRWLMGEPGAIHVQGKLTVLE